MQVAKILQELVRSVKIIRKIPKTFISYRRVDTDPIVDRMEIILKNHFGEANVVRDKTTFHIGKDFPDEIRSHLVESDFALIVIGKSWHREMEYRYAIQPQVDWVLLELEIAMADENKHVIPVMIDDAQIAPLGFELPPIVNRLQYKGGIIIRQSSYWFTQDMQRLIQKIEQSSGIQSKPAPNTDEELFFLLSNSRWEIPRYMDTAGETYVCKDDSRYTIKVDHSSWDVLEESYEADWLDGFSGYHSLSEVYVVRDEIPQGNCYFVNVDGGACFVPMPQTDGPPRNIDDIVYVWDVHSLGLKLARHIARVYPWQTSLDDFAKVANIEIRE